MTGVAPRGIQVFLPKSNESDFAEGWIGLTAADAGPFKIGTKPPSPPAHSTPWDVSFQRRERGGVSFQEFKPNWHRGKGVPEDRGQHG